MGDRNVFYAIDILDTVRCQGTFRQDTENKVVIYLENDLVAELQEFYFPVFEVHLYRAEGQLYLFVCSNEVSVYYLDEENRCKPKLIHKFAPNMYFDCIINLTILNSDTLYLRTGDRHIAFFNFTLSPKEMKTIQLLNTSLYSIQFVPRPDVENQFISLALPTDHNAVIQIYKLDDEKKQLTKIISDQTLPVVPDKIHVLEFQGDRPSRILYMIMQQLGMWELNSAGQLETTVLCNYAGFLIYNFQLLPNNLLCIAGTCMVIYDLNTRKYRLVNSFKDFSAENIIYTEKYGLILVGNGMKRIKNLEEVMQDDVDPIELVRKLNQ